ncbi:MAG: hypothetical protein JSU01_21865 [Bacteroidetes bacterium]|nr:hypothetical protein [Bacteroidota bacterium]
MRNVLLTIPIVLVLLASCKKKEVKQGTITYGIDYELPDSLKSYANFLPKSAIVYFKGDSTVTVQQAGADATTVITHKPTNFMRVMLRSDKAQYVIDYKKADQGDILHPANFIYAATTESKIILGHKATKFVLMDKNTLISSEVWFSKDIKMVPSYITAVFDTTYGVPLAFTLNQNGIITKTVVKEIKFEPVPDGVFSTPAGYKKLTPEQFKNLPVGN